MFEVEWTGEWPSLCCGKWIIKKNGVDVSDKIPESLRENDMNTYGTYDSWHFDEDYMEEWESYSDGLDAEEWIANNPWILNICSTEEEEYELFEAIQDQDWRHGSCGGCI